MPQGPLVCQKALFLLSRGTGVPELGLGHSLAREGEAGPTIDQNSVLYARRGQRAWVVLAHCDQGLFV